MTESQELLVHVADAIILQLASTGIKARSNQELIGTRFAVEIFFDYKDKEQYIAIEWIDLDNIRCWYGCRCIEAYIGDPKLAEHLYNFAIKNIDENYEPIMVTMLNTLLEDKEYQKWKKSQKST